MICLLEKQIGNAATTPTRIQVLAAACMSIMAFVVLVILLEQYTPLIRHWIHQRRLRKFFGRLTTIAQLDINLGGRIPRSPGLMWIDYTDVVRALQKCDIRYMLDTTNPMPKSIYLDAEYGTMLEFWLQNGYADLTLLEYMRKCLANE